jgi:regulator of protease activity HflC (stomatin/prohibitin superfamily)
MRKALYFSLLLLLLLLLMMGCSRVEVGHKGIKVNLLGSDKGVQQEELGPGRYWIGINEELYVFPTFTKNYVWTKDRSGGSPTDESFTFQTIEGMSVNADIGISFAVKPEKVSAVFQKYRKGLEEITDIFLRNMVRDALVKAASTRPIETVYGAGKTDLIREVEAAVREQTKEFLEIEHIYWIGELRLPQVVTQAINAKIQATQIAQQRENEVATAKAEAQKAIEHARGEAEARLLNAKSEAEAIRIKADALRANSDLVHLNAIEKWDGKLPQIIGQGPIPFLNIATQK